MIPFDPDALLAMLLAFYQPATPANLARAFRERPEYFAGGHLIGHSGDALQLQDGTVWDLMYDVDNATGNRHYQAIIPGGGSPGGSDLFPLEAGALSPIDPVGFVVPLPREDFIGLVAEGLVGVDGSHAQIDQNYDTILQNSLPTRVQAASTLYLEPAEAAHSGYLGSIETADPASVIAATNGHGAIINANDHSYDDPPPPDAPAVTAPPPPESPNQPGGGPPQF